MKKIYKYKNLRFDFKISYEYPLRFFIKYVIMKVCLSHLPLHWILNIYLIVYYTISLVDGYVVLTLLTHNLNSFYDK